MKPELSPTERLEIRVSNLEAGQAVMRGEIRQLTEAWSKFVPSVSDRITKKYLFPAFMNGLMNSINVPESLEFELKDPLDLRDFITKKKGDG